MESFKGLLGKAEELARRVDQFFVADLTGFTEPDARGVQEFLEHRRGRVFQYFLAVGAVGDSTHGCRQHFIADAVGVLPIARTVPFFDALATELRTTHGVAEVVRVVKPNYSAPAGAGILDAASTWHALIAGVGD